MRFLAIGYSSGQGVISQVSHLNHLSSFWGTLQIELYVTPFDRWGEESWHGPTGSVVSHFAADRVIGFTIIVNDREPPTETDWKNWGLGFQPSNEWNTTFWNVLNGREDTYHDGLLLPADATGLKGSAVDAVSWGRIKASLEFE